MVRIPGFHPGGPGSIPGMGKLIFFFPPLSQQLCLSLFHLVSDSVIQIILHEKGQDLDIGNTLLEQLEQHNIKAESLGQPFVVHVAKHPPLTRNQFTQASVCWPVNFHEDK